MKKIIMLVLVVGCLLSVFSYQAQAGVPMKMNVQGKLTDKDGKVFSEPQEIAFSLISPGEFLQLGTVPISTNSNGVFNVDLNIPAEGIQIFKNECKLQMKFTKDNTLLKQDITTVPYAFYAANAEKLGGLAATSYATKDAQGNIIGNVAGSFVKKTGDTMSGALTLKGTPAKLKVGESMNPPDIAIQAYGGMQGINATAGSATGSAVHGLSYADEGIDFGGVVGVNQKAGYGVSGSSVLGTGIYGQTSKADAYSGKFMGGKGIYVEGMLEATKGIKITGGDINITGGGSVNVDGQPIGVSDKYVLKTGDTMSGTLSVEVDNKSAGYFKGLFGVTGKAKYNDFGGGVVGLDGQSPELTNAPFEPVKFGVYGRGTNYGVYGGADGATSSGVYGFNKKGAGLSGISGGTGVNGIGVYAGNYVGGAALYANSNWVGPAIKVKGAIVGTGTTDATVPSPGPASDAFVLGSGKGGWDVIVNDDLYVKDKLYVKNKLTIPAGATLEVNGDINIKGNNKIVTNASSVPNIKMLILDYLFTAYGCSDNITGSAVKSNIIVKDTYSLVNYIVPIVALKGKKIYSISGAQNAAGNDDAKSPMTNVDFFISGAGTNNVNLLYSVKQPNNVLFVAMIRTFVIIYGD